MRRFELADILGLVVVLLWAVNLPLAKDALREFSPMSFNGVRIPPVGLALVDSDAAFERANSSSA